MMMHACAGCGCDLPDTDPIAWVEIGPSPYWVGHPVTTSETIALCGPCQTHLIGVIAEESAGLVRQSLARMRRDIDRAAERRLLQDI